MPSHELLEFLSPAELDIFPKGYYMYFQVCHEKVNNTSEFARSVFLINPSKHENGKEPYNV